MAREILFRAKRIDDGEWIEGCVLRDGLTGKYYFKNKNDCLDDNLYEVEGNNEDGFLQFKAYEVDHETVCQYTGLTDKNGRRIFEGDIFYDQNRNSFSVGFINCSFIAIPIKEITKKIIGRKWLTEFAGLSGYIEVIGNIFDNPELTGE